MNLVNDLMLVLSALMVALGGYQLAAGRNVLRFVARAREQPAAASRAFGGMYVFLGLLLALNASPNVFGRTVHFVVVALLAMGVFITATWSLVVFARAAEARR